MNHEAVVWVACAISSCLGYALGRMMKTPRPPAPKREPQPQSPYRDAAERVEVERAEEERREPVKQVRLYFYNNYDKFVLLACPACGGQVDELEVCDCAEVAAERTRGHGHFHVTCAICSLRFAMETRAAMFARQRAKAKEEPLAKEEPPEPKPEESIK